MFFFALYAVAAWGLAARWRRRWESFAWVAASLAGLILLAYLHWLLSIWTNQRIYLPVLQSLLYPYTVLVGLVGGFIACLPAASTIRGSIECPRCRYDLHGLEGETDSCPECGLPFSIVEGRVLRVAAEPMVLPAPVRRPPTPARRDRQRRRPGPPPVVLRWPPV